MKRELSFCNFVSRDIIAHGLLIAAALFIIEQIAFMLSFEAGAGVRFSSALDAAGFSVFFVGAMVFAAYDLVLCILRRFVGSKSIYGLYMMPVPKPLLFFTWLTSGVIVIMIITLARHLSVFCAHLQYVAMTEQLISERLASGLETTVKVENGALFTAYLRSEHLRMFLPFDFESGAKLFFTILSLPALSIRFALSIPAKKLPLSIILAIMWILFILLLDEAVFLGFVGLSFVAVFSFISAKNMATLGQML